MQGLPSACSRQSCAHVFIDWNQQPVLLLATRLLANRDEFFQHEKGAAYDRQQSKWVFEKETLCSYVIGEHLTSTNQCWSCRMLTSNQVKLTRSSINTGAMSPCQIIFWLAAWNNCIHLLQHCFGGVCRETVWRAQAFRGDGEPAICKHDFPKYLPNRRHQVRSGTWSILDNAPWAT